MTKIILARLFLVFSIISVILTSTIPFKNNALGKLLFQNYSGLYSALGLIVFLALYFVVSKQMKNDIWTNRLKLLLSCSFLISLCTNIFFN